MPYRYDVFISYRNQHGSDRFPGGERNGYSTQQPTGRRVGSQGEVTGKAARRPRLHLAPDHQPFSIVDPATLELPPPPPPRKPTP